MKAFYSFLAAYLLSTALTNAAAIPPGAVLAPTSSVGPVSKRNVYGSNIGKSGVQGMTIEARAGDTTLAPDLEKRGEKRDRAHLSTPPDAQAQHADSMKNLVSRVSQLGFDKLNKERKEGKVQQQLVDEYTAVVNGDLMKVAAETERDMEKKEGDHSEPGSANTSPTSSESGFSDNDSGNEADEEDTRTERPHVSPSNLQHALRFLDIARANFITRSKGYRRELVNVVLMVFAKEREQLIASVHKAEERAEKRLKSN